MLFVLAVLVADVKVTGAAIPFSTIQETICKRENRSIKCDADFPFVLKYSDKYNLGSKSSPNGKHAEVTGLHFRINGANILYNPSDAGQYIWGAWMRANGFTLPQVIIVSNLNEWSTGFDSKGDQRAIKNGYGNMDKWMKF